MESHLGTAAGKALAGLLGIVALGGLSARAESPPLATLEGLVGQWTELRRLAAEEERAWTEARESLEEEVRLLAAEREALRSRRADAESARTRRTAERAEGEASLARHRAVVEETAPRLDSAERALRELARQVPPPLRGDLDALVRQLPAAPEAAQRLGLARRLQTVLALLARIESLQHGTHAGREVIGLDPGPAREVETLYVGLALGYAVNADGTWAAVGRPGPDGWTWSPRPGLAPQVRAALDVHGRATSPRLVHLPVHLPRAEDETP